MWSKTNEVNWLQFRSHTRIFLAVGFNIASYFQDWIVQSPRSTDKVSVWVRRADKMFQYLAILGFLSIAADCFPTKEHVDTFNLTVVHINDIHAHFEEINANTSRCRAENDCFGGVARLNYKKNEIMNNAPNSIFLNAGDFYQGCCF